MTERPILFSGPMVRAILAGRKTQTRRLVTPGTSVVGTHEPWDHLVLGGSRKDGDPERFGEYLHVPHRDGETVHRVYPRIGPGDTLWVRETWGCSWLGDEPGVRYRADLSWRPTHAPAPVGDGRWKPSIHMPRWASRLTLRVEAVRVQRVQDISGHDAMAEGIERALGESVESVRQRFASLWDSINGKRAPWSSDPWVWVVTFERVGGER